MVAEIRKIKDPVERLFWFCNERYLIHLRRKAGDKPPWTKDPVLRDFRFCNIYREDDKVTIWIRENWREPHSKDKDLWFAMCVARLLNLPESLSVVGYPVPFDNVKFLRLLGRHYKAGGQIFNGAYIVSTNGKSAEDMDYLTTESMHTPKVAFLAHEVLTPMWKNRTGLRPKEEDTLNSYHMLLGQLQGFGSFMSGQVIADLKYHEPLRHASDWETFAASGPGSRRGLNYVLERDRGASWTEETWRLELGRLRPKLLPMFKAEQMPLPHAQDIQNCLCEYSKWHAVVFEGKKPKQRYRWEAMK
jgi:5-hmdU DNA kinase-like protein